MQWLKQWVFSNNYTHSQWFKIFSSGTATWRSSLCLSLFLSQQNDHVADEGSVASCCFVVCVLRALLWIRSPIWQPYCVHTYYSYVQYYPQICHFYCTQRTYGWRFRSRNGSWPPAGKTRSYDEPTRVVDTVRCRQCKYRYGKYEWQLSLNWYTCTPPAQAITQI